MAGAGDVREHGAGPDETEGASAGSRARSAGGRYIGHGPEGTGGDRGQEAGREQRSEAGADGDVTCGEDAQGEHQGQPRGQPQREHRRQRRADDRPDGEDGVQKPGRGDADLQVSRDLGQQAGHDELGGAHQERVQREHAHDERKPGGRCPLGLLDSITMSAAFVRDGRPDVVATTPLTRALHAPMRAH